MIPSRVAMMIMSSARSSTPRLEGRHAVGHGLGSRHGEQPSAKPCTEGRCHGLGANAGQRRDILDLARFPVIDWNTPATINSSIEPMKM